MSKTRTVRRTTSPSQPAQHDAANAVAWRMYEMCVCKGYVDGRDWFEADAELRAESRRAIRQASAQDGN